MEQKESESESDRPLQPGEKQTVGNEEFILLLSHDPQAWECMHSDQ